MLSNCSCGNNYVKLELCNNLGNKIIKVINLKIMVFYYRDNSKFLDITVYYTKNNYIGIQEQLGNKICIYIILLLLHYNNYCYRCEI